MSYQVLARKWRPQTFSGLVGQRHVLQALVNALDHQRLHHAYLFTGTRGVGKTTLARLFAKGLNCEQGITSTPCGVCQACVEIAENRFVDLIEVDAASRTKVEDTRDLLDNVPYAPTRGRYKVYLIDEVHMLSNHSFNALLKTLEEPPEHVKFLLATTDPQKLPVTVLSRCLQFNLKTMTPELVMEHLGDILDQEGVAYEPAALAHLGKAAQGSMRDALSLTDQALAFGNGELKETEVAELLGTIDTGRLLSLITALAEHDVAALLAAVADLGEYTPDWQQLMADLLDLLHHLTIVQQHPDYVLPASAEPLRVEAGKLAPEDVQLFYQLGLQAWKDLAFAPGPKQAFEMALLRMLAFVPGELPMASTRAAGTGESGDREPESESEPGPGTRSAGSDANASAAPETDPAAEPHETPAAETPSAVNQGTQPDLSPDTATEPMPGADNEPAPGPGHSDPEAGPESEPEPDPGPDSRPVPASEAQSEVPPQTEPCPDDTGDSGLAYRPATGRALDQARLSAESVPDVWVDLIPALELGGAMGNMVQHANAIGVDGSGRLQVRIDGAYEALYQSDFGSQLLEALQNLGIAVQSVQCEFGELSQETAHSRDRRKRQESIQQARQSLETEPVVRELINEFNATWVAGSIESREQPGR